MGFFMLLKASCTMQEVEIGLFFGKLRNFALKQQFIQGGVSL